MNIEFFREYCLKKKGVTEEFPFNESTLVFKVAGKMFALTDVGDFTSINLKADPEESVELQEQFPAVQPGYHMSKKHWITVMMDNSVPDRLLCQWIDNSYNLVVQRLTKGLRSALEKSVN